MSPPVFVVGVPRSGTTLLRRHLNAHPDLHLTFEASWFGVRASQPKGWTPAERRVGWERSLSLAWQRASLDKIAPVEVDPGVCADPHLPYARLMKRCAQRAGKARWGDKSPAHITHVGSLLESFPGCRIVHIVRDPVRVVESLLAVPWGNPSILGNALTVRALLKRVAPFRDRIHELRLEDLLADRRGALADVLDFCDLPWSEQVLDPDTFAVEDTPPLPWLRTRSADRAQAHERPRLPPVDRHRVARVTAQARHSYGYPELDRVSRGSLGAHLQRAWTDIREGVSVVRFLMGLRRQLHTLPGPDAVSLFDAVNHFHVDAALACTPEQRAHLVNWLSPDAPSG